MSLSLPSCVFCQIVERGTTDDGLAFRWESEHSVVFEPLNPVTPGHWLVVPRRHVEDFAAYPGITALVYRDAADFVREFRIPQANLITSKGPDATQTVFHLHVHVVMRRTGDGLKLPWSE
jgi:histidine triad (HIT) family protein